MAKRIDVSLSDLAFKNIGILNNYLPDVMPRLLRELHTVGILTEDLALPEDPNELDATYRGLCHLPHIEGSRRRRIDILSVSWSSRGAALLYFTVCFWLMLAQNIHLNKHYFQGDDIVRRLMK
jgi:hypothetical protein